jgi:hypothetical protein
MAIDSEPVETQTIAMAVVVGQVVDLVVSLTVSRWSRAVDQSNICPSQSPAFSK